MTVAFGSDSMTISQSEFISFEKFLDQTCKVYDTLWPAFDIERIHLPSIKVIAQKGFDDDKIDEASEFLMSLRLCSPHSELAGLLGGSISAVDLVMVTEEELEWNEWPVHQRRRLQTQVVRQEKQAPFDERLLKRSRQLGDRQRDAIQGLLKLRRMHPPVAPVAAQLDMENSFETEFDAAGFDLPKFLEQSWLWAESVRTGVFRLDREKA